jgi:hypothetical protein
MTGTTKEVQSIGYRLRTLRYALGYGGRQKSASCRKIGIENVSQWQQHEDGTKRIRIDEAIHVTNMTGATLDWIYRGDTWLWTLPGRLLEAIPSARGQIADEAHQKATEATND